MTYAYRPQTHRIISRKDDREECRFILIQGSNEPWQIEALLRKAIETVKNACRVLFNQYAQEAV